MDSDWLLPLSHIAEYSYCPRRASLLMNQQLWTENEYTAEGRLQHERTHDHRIERRNGKLNLYEFPVWSDTLHVHGFCDCIEATQTPDGAELPGESGRYSFYPVEYKHGVVRDEAEYNQQLCAQAICLEEMYHTAIPQGAIFYIGTHRRQEVEFTEALRTATRKTAKSLWDCAMQRKLFPAVYSAKCKKCAMQENCQPKLTLTAQSYCQSLLNELKG